MTNSRRIETASARIRHVPIGWADLVLALEDLCPEGEARETVAAMLGLELRSTTKASSPASPRSETKAPLPSASPAETATPRLGNAGDGPPLVVAKHTESEPRSSAPDWLMQTPALALPGATRQTAPPPPPALFSPRLQRNILGALLATAVEDGEIRIEPLVDALAHRRAIRQLPRRPRWTLVRGVQVLLDYSERMEPFSADREQLVRDLDELLADNRTQIRSFATSLPHRMLGRGYELPLPGTPVLLVSDLGVGGHPMHRAAPPTSEWLDLFDLLDRNESPIRVLSPYPPERLPTALAGRVALLPWDRRTRVGEAAVVARRRRL